MQAVEVVYDGSTPIQPTDSVERYIDNLAADAALQIRYQASKWTFIGCHRVNGLVGTILSDVPPAAKHYDEDPLTCSVKCEAIGSDVSAMQSTTCYCLGPGRTMLESVYEAVPHTDSECTLACKASYFGGIARLCGGEPLYVSVFQKYDYFHQTAGAAYDPWRSMWYQSVAVQSLDGTLLHVLQAVSLSSGEPQFPFHYPTVDEQGNSVLLLGLQFDLDSSRVVGYAFPDWRGKGDANQSWGPAVWDYRINTMTESTVNINRTKHAFAFDSDNPTASSEIYGVSATALDSIHNVYYLVVPEIPSDLYSGGEFYTARNRVYAVDLTRSSGGGAARVVASRVLADESEDESMVPNYRCVLLEANSKYHTLYALVQKSNNGAGDDTHQYYYVKLGSTYVDEDDFTQLEWTFESVEASMVNNVPPYDKLYLDFVNKTFSVGMSSVDSVTNTSFLVYRESPDPSSAAYLTDVPQDGRNATEGFTPQTRPVQTQGVWFANTDPIIPLELAAPKMVSARFSTDARQIYVDFDVNTIEGALPVDSDGDTIPDLVDWTSKQVGLRDCSDMFTTATVAKLASLPEISCEWASSSRIQINLPSIWWNINVHDSIVIKEATVYSYITDGNQWSIAASGGVIIANPDPVFPPVIEATYASVVDFYSGVTFDASGSGNHGTLPEWRWSLFAPVHCDFGFEDSTITASLTQELQAACYVDLDNPGSMILEIEPGMMQAGCTYSFKLNLTSRWQLWNTKIMNVSKAMVPAPQVYIMGPAIVEYIRSTTLNLQADVEDSVYEGQMDSQQAVFAWSATRRTYDASDSRNDELYGPLEAVTISELTDRYSSTSLQVPRYTLEPGYLYTFTVTSGYSELDPDLGYGTAAEVGVLVGRSDLKVNVLGGSRVVSKDNPIAVIDATTSLDPDFPLDDVSSSAEWVFTYYCSVTSGDPPVTRSCFESITVNTSVVWDATDCSVPSPPLTFVDLDRAYSIPTFSSEPTLSSSSYCTYPGSNGVLILNLQGVGGLDAGDYSFVVEGAANDRTANAILELRVTSPFLRLPQVVVQPSVQSVVQAKVPIDARFATEGDLAAEDKATYGSAVAWAWSFYKVVTNSAYNTALASAANDGGTPYLVPEFVLELTDEIDRLSTPLTSATLVIPANVMQASTTYNFRLSGTVTDPANGDVLTGYADLVVMTAGSAPCCGTLAADLNSSTVIQTRTFTASDWVADDLPLSYMFQYRVDLQNQYTQNVDLRVAFIAEPTQSVWCMRPGEVADNFSVEVTVKVQTAFGATSDPYSILTTVEPPADWMAANELILSRLEETDAEAGAVVSNCFMLSDPNPGFSTSATSTEQIDALADSVVSRLVAQSESVPLTPAVATAYLGSVQKMAQDGVVSDSIVDFVSGLSDKVIQLSGEESYSTVLDMSSKVFSAIGQLLVASQDSAETTAAQAATDVNANGDETGAFFPAARSGRRLSSARAGAGRAGCRRPRSLAERVRLPSRQLRPLDERPLLEGASYQVGSCAYPDWTVLPMERRDRRYWPPSARGGRRLTAAQQLEEAYEVQEALEQEWIAYLAAIEQQQQAAELTALRDEEYFANYSAHLSPEERETVIQAWSAEKAAALDVRTAQLALHKRTLQSMLDMASAQSANFATNFMVTEEDPTDFFFQAGELKVGKNRDLSSASSAFSFRDKQWELPANSSETFEWELLKFTESNPWYFASNTITGPYIINGLKVFDQNGTVLPISGLSEPLNIMADHSSFASGVCRYFDWDADGGLGAWSSDGVVTDDNGCATTHLSIVGLFLEATSPGEAFQEALELALNTEVVDHNAVVSFALGASLVLGGMLHYWAFKQDGVDALKPVEIRELADGVKGPRSQDDPVHYADGGAEQVLFTVWNMVRRDHILVACFFRDPRLRVTRLQRASVLSAALAGSAAASAVLYGEHAVDPRHHVEIGIVSSTVSFPMVALLLVLFASRPARDGAAAARAAGQQRLSPLWALPVPADERSEESASDSATSRGAERLQNPAPLPPLPSAEGHLRQHAAGSAEAAALATPHHRPAWGAARAAEPAMAAQASVPSVASRRSMGPAGSAPMTAQASVPSVASRRSLPPAGLPPSTPPAAAWPPPLDGPRPEAARAPARLLEAEGVHGMQPNPQDGAPRRSLPPAGPPPVTTAQASVSSVASQRFMPPAGSPPMSAQASVPSVSSQRSLPPAGPPPTEPLPAARLGPLGEEASRPLGAGAGLDWSSEGEGAVHPAASHDEAGDWGLPGANEGSPPERVPPAPPLRDPRRAWTEDSCVPQDQQHAPPPPQAGPPRGPAPPLVAASSAQLEARTNLLRRVRRMYIEKVIQNSERLAYDERLDIRQAATLPVVVLARAIAYIAVICYWVVALALCAIYGVHFGAGVAEHWAYSCLSGWLFTWLVLEMVKILLAAFLELAQLWQRQRAAPDRSAMEGRVARLLEAKDSRMAAKAASARPKLTGGMMLSAVPAPPLPSEPPPALGPPPATAG